MAFKYEEAGKKSYLMFDKLDAWYFIFIFLV